MRLSESRAVFATVGSFLLTLTTAVAQQDVRGSADHSLFPTRMPGFYISSHRQVEFEAVRLRTDKGPITVEGKVTRINYRRMRDAPNPGGLAIRRNYENAVRGAGGEVVGQGGGWSTVRATTKDGMEVWAEISASNTASAQIYQLTIVERQAMKQVITAGAMAAALEKDGSIVLYIDFETAKAVLLPDATPVLEQVVQLMRGNPALRLRVEGHTDEVGTEESNRALSDARAKAVVAALVSRGVDAMRLQATGVGESRPFADNTTDEGRAKNRRVELVKMAN